MDITYSWLKEYVNFNLTPEQIGDILTNIGLEVEHQVKQETIPGGLAGVIVAKVVECEKHPDSDHLHITKVDTGAGEFLQVVCGAPNVAAGQKVMLATIGTKLFIGGEEVKIKKSKIRGVESFGMLCAEDELGIGEDHSGIIVLPCDATIGTPAKEYYKLQEDTVYSIGLTPNRVDAASLIGVARDLSAYLRLNNQGGELTLPSVEDFKEGEGKGVEIVLDAPTAAPRYSGLTIEGITVKESPEWLKKRLISVGMRPINNIVDITNFILMEMGSPLHAFDVEKIKGGKVVVGFCKEGTKFITLDGVERKLSAEDLMICNAEAPMCIGGVFGGEESGITESTTSVFIESAYFNPVYIRKTSKRHALKTEASFRFERGCDPNNTLYALKRAALLVLELAGGKVRGAIQDIYPDPISKKRVELNYARMESLAGCRIGADTIKKILEYQDMEFESSTPDGCVVKVPTYKVDVYRECDVVEEVLRIYGYNNVPLPESLRCSVNITPKPDKEQVLKSACDLLTANGFVETMNNSLTRSAYYEDLSTFPSASLVRIYNPLSSDLDALRQTLIFSGLEVVAYNINHQEGELKLYEFGNVYSFNPDYKAPEGESHLKAFTERPKLSLFMCGEGAKWWRHKTEGGDFFALKGFVELLLARFGIQMRALDYEVVKSDLFSSAISYKLHGSAKELFVIGTISTKLLKKFGIGRAVYVAEISWDVLFRKIEKQRVQFTELPKYPAVRRDLALLVDYNIPFAELRTTAFATEKKLLSNVVLFDFYTGDKIPKDKKQYAISFYLQDPDKTLTDKEVEGVMQRLLGVFKQKFGAELR